MEEKYTFRMQNFDRYSECWAEDIGERETLKMIRQYAQEHRMWIEWIKDPNGKQIYACK